MSYRVVWGTSGDEDFHAIAATDPIAASKLLDQIDRFAENPVTHARAPGLPHISYPKFQFWIPTDDGEENFYFTVLFAYLKNEDAIEIVGIARQRVPLDYPFGPRP
jgi:hypothetical protein